jgi:uncharacterized protein YceH (UPF0502 family)
MMSEQAEKTTTTVAEMLRTTGNNTAQFMFQIAEHIEKLETEVARLQERVTEMEGQSNATK